MVWGYHLRDYGWTPLSQNPARICDDSFRSLYVGRQRYETRSRSQPQLKVFAVLPISADGGLTNIHPMRRGGVKSFVDDLVLGRGVVISRAATSLRSVETQPLTRRFVRIRRATSSAHGQALSLLGLLALLLFPFFFSKFFFLSFFSSVQSATRLSRELMLIRSRFATYPGLYFISLSMCVVFNARWTHLINIDHHRQSLSNVF